MKANRAQIADIFGVAKTTVDAWRKRGLPVTQEGGKGVAMQFDTVEVYTWLTETMDKDEDYTRLLEFEKYREKKRGNDLEEQKVAPVELLSDSLEKAGNVIVPILETLPLEMKRFFPEITGDQITLVKQAIAECRNAIADMEIEI